MKPNPKKDRYLNPYGLWKVTTEGDVEGRTIRQLGIHKGYIDEIALALADRCYYSLNFKAVDPTEKNHLFPTRTKVNVQLDIDSGTWDMHGKTLVEYAKEIFKDRPVVVDECNYYASFTLLAQNEKEAKEKVIREKALKKLSEEERKVLGV